MNACSYRSFVLSTPQASEAKQAGSLQFVEGTVQVQVRRSYSVCSASDSCCCRFAACSSCRAGCMHRCLFLASLTCCCNHMAYHALSRLAVPTMPQVRYACHTGFRAPQQWLGHGSTNESVAALPEGKKVSCGQ